MKNKKNDSNVGTNGITSESDKDILAEEKKLNKKKARAFTSVFYPESVNLVDVIEKLDNEHIEYIISPLHDKDKNPDGTLKKAHYHLMIIYDGPRSWIQGSDLLHQLGGVGCQVVQNQRLLARYFCHMDNPDKFRYQEEDVIAYGIDYHELIQSASDVVQLKKDVVNFVRENKIVSYSELVNYCLDNNTDWFKCVTENTIFFRSYLRSCTWTADTKNKKNAPTL